MHTHYIRSLCSAADVIGGHLRGKHYIFEITHRNDGSRRAPPTTNFRKTKVVCTIGPATWDRERLFKLADEGMNVARLNMSHGYHASHKKVAAALASF